MDLEGCYTSKETPRYGHSKHKILMSQWQCLQNIYGLLTLLKKTVTAANSVPEFDHGLVVDVAVLGDGVGVDLQDLHATLLVGQRDFNLSEIDEIVG